MSTVDCRLILLLGLIACLLLAPLDAQAQYFGRNKVEYHDFDFKVLDTDHFAIYYYPREEQAVRHAARLAERWYARLSKLLDHTLSSRQALVLYGSHSEFTQTNVISQFLDESVGGVTESLRRRIVMPFAPGLGETDHVLGHEIVHAFQMDILKRQKHPLWMPLWFAEGMAEYLTLGPADSLTATWIRDSAEHGTLPHLRKLTDRGVSPYRHGHALWAYLAGRFGDGIIPRILKADETGDALERVARITGIKTSTLSDDWHSTTQRTFRPLIDEFREPRPRPLVASGGAGRLNLGPSLSPDGRELVFLSEKDRLSIDIFLADAATGAIKRKLLTRAADPHLDSLQFVKSSGAWDPTGERFVLSAVRGGVPVLLFLDVHRGGREHEIQLPQFGEILTPTWSPDGHAVAFAALEGGLTDLYVYDLKNGAVTRLTGDAFTDLQPSWSPDGRHLAFVTDRFSSDLAALRFGNYQLALLDLETRSMRALPGFNRAKNIDPQWSSDGSSLFFLSDPSGISNVFRLDLPTGTLSQITNVSTGVMGLTSTSPALSVSRSGSKLAFSVFRLGKYEIEVIESEPTLAGGPLLEPATAGAGILPPHDREENTVSELLNDPSFGLPVESEQIANRYTPTLSLEALGQPYLSSGGSRYGSFVRGGMSFLFGDMLGERRLGAAVQVGSRLEDFAGQLRFLNRESRWNWGGTAELLPYVRGGSRRRSGLEAGQPAVIKETERLRQMHSRLAGFIAYPFSRAQRIELAAGVRQIVFDREVRSRIFSAASRKLIREERQEDAAGRAVGLAETSAALVYDSAIWGPASPILGTRSRLEIAPNIGGMSFTSLVLDYRRYVMPVRPYTIAARVQYSARYGGDGNDSRLRPLFIGYRNLIRGYDVDSLNNGCSSTLPGECVAVDKLTGSRMLVGNLEVRFPLVGAFSRTSTYGRVPAEGVLFADAGIAWGGLQSTISREPPRPLRSAGAAVRLAPFGYIVQVGVVHAFDHPARRWRFLLDFRPGF